MRICRIGSIVTVALGVVVVLAAPRSFAQGRISSADTAALTIGSPHGWTVGVRGQLGRRKFETADEIIPLDLSHYVARIGFNVLPFATLMAEAGVSRADWDKLEGERGFEWAALAEVNVLEHIIRESPVVGKKESVGLATRVIYRHSESNFENADLDWSDTKVQPYIYYAVNRRGEPIWHPYEPDGARVLGGLAFSRIEGDFGDEALKEERNFGLLAGAELRSAKGWTMQIDVVLYGSSDNEVSLGAAYHF